MTNQFLKAKLYIIGVGPGDPDLLTLKAVRLIGTADVIAYPTISNGQSRARKTASEYITKLHKEVAFHLPMEVNPAAAQQAYDSVSQRIRKHLEDGRSVALLCEGDPFFYGSAIHVYARLARDYTIRIVPGVSSLTAGAAAAGLPLAMRSDILKILPATLDYERLKAELSACETAIIIKIGRHFEKVARAIRSNNLCAQAVLVARASQDNQHICPFTELSTHQHGGEQPYFSMVLISRHRKAA